MDMNFDFESVYPRHDLLIEIGCVELAIDHLQERDVNTRTVLLPRLESRMNSLMDALSHLAV